MYKYHIKLLNRPHLVSQNTGFIGMQVSCFCCRDLVPGPRLLIGHKGCNKNDILIKINYLGDRIASMQIDLAINFLRSGHKLCIGRFLADSFRKTLMTP